MASGILVILLIAALSSNSQALIAQDSLEEDVAFDLERGEQPWLALVALPGGVPCSASIVSPTSLLSAAVCLKGATNLTHGVVYAGNVKYTVPEEFGPPTQNRSVVDCILYDENSTLEYNIMLVKIAPKWIWSSSVQPVGVIDMERLPENLTASCLVSGLGGGSDSGSSQVARSASVWIGACARSPQPLDHRMCLVDSVVLAPRAGDVGGPVLCEDKLYGIMSEHGQSISEELPEPDKIPSCVSGFQFVGFYLSWINKTAGDLLCDADIQSLRRQHQHGHGRQRRLRNDGEPEEGGEGGEGGNDDDTGSDTGDDATDGAGDTGTGPAGSDAAPAGSGAGRLCASALLAPLLAAAVRALC